MKARRIVAAFALLACCAAHAQQNPAARYATLSAPDCVAAANIIAEAAQEPVDVTHMRVQHIGDPDSAELAGEIANFMTWDVGALTGLRVPYWEQLGYRNEEGASAFQLHCNAAGFFINSNTFAHASPLFGEGPSANVGRVLDPAPPAFTDNQSTLLIEARVAVPTARAQQPPVSEGVAQVSFLYYMRDATSGIVFAHVIGLFDNRAPGVNGSAQEGLGNDGITAFASSPLRELDASGAPVQFVAVSPQSASMRFEPWQEPALFRAEIPYAKFKAMLERLKRDALPSISTEPRDFRVLFFGAGGEIMVGTGNAHNVMLGANLSDLALSIIPGRPRFRH